MQGLQCRGAARRQEPRGAASGVHPGRRSFSQRVGWVRLVCGKDAAVAALHAAALEPELFSAIELPLPPTGWAEFVRTPQLTLAPGEVVAAALKTYDLPELICLIPAGKLQPAPP